MANIKSHIKNNTIEIKHGIFFNGQIFDAYALLTDLIKSGFNEKFECQNNHFLL
jgi:hypothetical protein